MSERKMRKVVRVELRTTVKEHVVKTTVREYTRGRSETKEFVERVTKTRPAALLDCGHWRDEESTGPSVATAKRLMCWECDFLAAEAERHSNG